MLTSLASNAGRIPDDFNNKCHANENQSSPTAVPGLTAVRIQRPSETCRRWDVEVKKKKTSRNLEMDKSNLQGLFGRTHVSFHSVLPCLFVWCPEGTLNLSPRPRSIQLDRFSSGETILPNEQTTFSVRKQNKMAAKGDTKEKKQSKNIFVQLLKSSHSFGETFHHNVQRRGRNTLFALHKRHNYAPPFLFFACGRKTGWRTYYQAEMVQKRMHLSNLGAHVMKVLRKKQGQLLGNVLQNRKLSCNAKCGVWQGSWLLTIKKIQNLKDFMSTVIFPLLIGHFSAVCMGCIVFLALWLGKFQFFSLIVTVFGLKYWSI